MDNLLSTQLTQSQSIVKLLDGLQLDLNNGSKAIIKFAETQVNKPYKETSQTVSQIFETVIREG